MSEYVQGAGTDPGMAKNEHDKFLFITTGLQQYRPELLYQNITNLLVNPNSYNNDKRYLA